MNAYSDPILFTVNLAVNLLLFGGLIAGGVAVSFRLLKNANPRLRYLLSVTAFLLATLLPFAVTLNGSLNLNQYIASKKGGGENFSNTAFFDQTFLPSSENTVSFLNSASENATADLLNDSTAFVADSFIGKTLFILWILGAGVFVFRTIIALRHMRKERNLRREAFLSERKELEIPDNISLYFGETSPATIGFFYPSIILPESFPDDLSLLQKRYVAQHELSHVLWRDPLVNFLLRLVRAVFWVSPALWMLERIVVNEREAAADRFAVANGCNDKSELEETAVNYAKTLVSVAQHFNLHIRRGFKNENAVGLYNGAILENRVRRLLSVSSKTTNLRIFSAAIIFAASLIGLFFMPIAFQPEEINNLAQAIVTGDESVEKRTQNENLSDAPAANLQDDFPKFIKSIESKNIAASRNGNKPGKSSANAKETVQTPRLILWQNRTLSTNADDGTADNSESLIKKRSKEDAQTADFNKRVVELRGKVQELDASRRNLGSNIPQVRQKAAAQINLLLQEKQPTNVPVQKSN